MGYEFDDFDLSETCEEYYGDDAYYEGMYGEQCYEEF